MVRLRAKVEGAPWGVRFDLTGALCIAVLGSTQACATQVDMGGTIVRDLNQSDDSGGVGEDGTVSDASKAQKAVLVGDRVYFTATAGADGDINVAGDAGKGFGIYYYEAIGAWYQITRVPGSFAGVPPTALTGHGDRLYVTREFLPGSGIYFMHRTDGSGLSDLVSSSAGPVFQTIHTATSTQGHLYFVAKHDANHVAMWAVNNLAASQIGDPVDGTQAHELIDCGWDGTNGFVAFVATVGANKRLYKYGNGDASPIAVNPLFHTAHTLVAKGTDLYLSANTEEGSPTLYRYTGSGNAAQVTGPITEPAFHTPSGANLLVVSEPDSSPGVWSVTGANGAAVTVLDSDSNTITLEKAYGMVEHQGAAYLLGHYENGGNDVYGVWKIDVGTTNAVWQAAIAAQGGAALGNLVSTDGPASLVWIEYGSGAPWVWRYVPGEAPSLHSLLGATSASPQSTFAVALRANVLFAIKHEEYGLEPWQFPGSPND